MSGLPERYEDLGLIARGGFGEVRRVFDRTLQATLAMKVLQVEHADGAEVRRRFLAEARLTAWLNHPGIVAVQDLGELADGRVWYTMQEVRGETLTTLVEALHRGDRWTLRRGVDVLQRACEAVASAHAVGVIHRDLKPDNLMIGPFGEVRVMDWGLARRLDTPEAAPEAATEATPPLDRGGSHTVDGAIMGTPTYMPPEQARGALADMGPWSDVYALGATLYQLLAGHPPYPGGGRVAWRAVLNGPPPPLPSTVPPELAAIVLQAMARTPADRFPEAGVLAAALQRWLDGDADRARALQIVADADGLRPRVATLRADATARASEARAALAAVPTWAPEDEKRAGWALLHAAEAAAVEADLLEVSYENTLRAALNLRPTLEEGLERIADLHRDQLVAAEATGDTRAAAQAEARLVATGRRAAWLAESARLFLDTDPAGVRVVYQPWVRDGLRLVPGPEAALGVTPLDGVAVPPGRHLLTLFGPSGPLRLPIAIARGEAWRASRPGTPAWTLRLPRPGELGADDVFVPGGWTVLGGDPDAVDPEPDGAAWIDSFVMRRHPVTLAAYVAFLDALLAEGRVDEAENWQPREPLSGASPPPILAREGAGFSRANRRGWAPEVPVVLVPQDAARAFATWEAARTGQPWRLPTSYEREKAARGTDGRRFPWGDAFDPAFANATGSLQGAADLLAVHHFPHDESPYGIRGLAGNVRDWCADPYHRLGAPRVGGLLAPGAVATDPAFVSVRGGAYVSSAALCRSASRFASPPGGRYTTLGFRLARDG